MFDEKQNQKDICRALAWQHGDKDAAEALLKQYQPLIRSIRQNFCQGLSYEDLEQELILHFLEQTACYDPKKNPSFAGYITPRLRWQRMNCIRKEMTREDHEELTLEDQAEGTSLDDYGEAKAMLEEVARLACLTKKQKARLFPLDAGTDAHGDLHLHRRQPPVHHKKETTDPKAAFQVCQGDQGIGGW